MNFSVFFALFLSTVYKISEEKSIIIEEFGSWNPDKGLSDKRETRIVSRRRRNLRHHQFKVADVYIYEGSENHLDLDDYKFVLLTLFFWLFWSFSVMFSL